MSHRFINYCLMAVGISAVALQAQSMHGTITDAVTKKPIQGAAVTLAEISRTFTTDSNGNYSTDPIAAGTFTVKITAPDYLKFTKKVIITSPKNAGISELEFNAGLYHVSTTADTSEGTMSVKYLFPAHDNVAFVIRNATGKIVKKAFDRSRAGGMRTFSWDGRDDEGAIVPPGQYTCAISSGNLITIRSLRWKGAPAPGASPETVAAPAKTPDAPLKTPQVTPPAPAKAEETPEEEDTDTTQTPEEAPETPAK
jgi:hypothetical protein